MHCLLRLKRSWVFFLVILKYIFSFSESQVNYFILFYFIFCVVVSIGWVWFGGLGTFGSIWLLGKFESGRTGNFWNLEVWAAVSLDSWVGE